MKHLIYMAFAMLLLASCSSDEPANGGNTQAEPIELSRSEQEIIDAQKHFSVNFFKKAYQMKKEDENQFLVSPLSVSMGLSMLANGAEGETHSEIISVLGYGSSEIEVVNKLNKTLLTRLPSIDGKTTVALANSLWVDQRNTAKPEYSQLLLENYGSEVRKTDLRSQTGVDEINAWTKEKTNGMIPVLISSVPGGKFALCNAIYFAGKWSDAFDVKDTKRYVFHNDDGSTSDVDMMYQNEDMESYAEQTVDIDKNVLQGTKVVRKYYGNGAYSMTFVLPAENVTIDEYIASLDVNTLVGLESKLGINEVVLRLPRFECEYGNEQMEEVLKGMGLVKTFSPDAELTKIVDTHAVALGASHKTKIKVDESGTVAAAATFIGGEYIAGAAYVMTFDRPFMYYISEQSTGAILFMGCVNAF